MVYASGIEDGSAENQVTEVYFPLCGLVSHDVLTFAGGIRCANAKPLLMGMY